MNRPLTPIRCACTCFALALLLRQPAAAQQAVDSTALRPDSTIQPKKSYWQASLNYMSDNVYLGRKDSVKIPYLVPGIGYYHSSGLFADLSAACATIPGDYHIDLISLEAGYAITKGNFDGQIAASKYYYSSQSYSVRSEIKGSVVADAGYDLQWIKPTLEATLNFDNATDYGIGLGLQRTFYAAGDAIDFTPSFVANAGTQNYYNSYYKRRRYSRTRNGKTIKGTITATVIDPSAFRILDYEASLPVNYTLHKFVFSFTPTLAFPVDPAMLSRTVDPDNGAPATKTVVFEKLQNNFFWTLGLTYKF
ncbi:MAG: hypothetical protein Q8927_16695 [Bacteroidota bacterium]|nr:hypothetical protein [Bacteroidota bacterium]MDP4217843.1 hypothetical protein [Bacteroidota bacterium]MDP4245978.1 hypothetical protein [Bacteroidota bacterium]MDP4255395.1 hypothetical protein [Bacteroidota bacterium]MDP4257751.1 hypothetical protein [Bacteroidota bacterium]